MGFGVVVNVRVAAIVGRVVLVKVAVNSWVGCFVAVGGFSVAVAEGRIAVAVGSVFALTTASVASSTVAVTV